MGKLTFIFVLATCSLLFGCEAKPDSKNQDSDLQKKAETSLLLKNLDQFNANLSKQYDGPRLFDLKTNSVIEQPMTRGFNWRSFGWADACGAFAGGKSGAI